MRLTLHDEILLDEFFCSCVRQNIDSLGGLDNILCHRQFNRPEES